MTKVAHESTAPTRSNVEALARRLLALRSDIDDILVRLATAPAPAASVEALPVADPVEEPVPVSPPHTTDNLTSAEPTAGQECMGDGNDRDAAQSPVGEGPSSSAAAPAVSSGDCVHPSLPPLDDLTLICPVDEALAESLNRLGIVAFAQIAGWSKRDVVRLSKALGLGRRICKENWIEQAAMLASGCMTAFAGGCSGITSGSIWKVGPAPTRADDVDVFACAGEDEIRVPAPATDKPADGENLQPDQIVETVPPASGGSSRPAGPVLSLEPYRGVPKVPVAARRAKPRPAAHGGLALAMKLAACLIALVVAGLVMVDRSAWGSAPAHKKALQTPWAGVSAGVRPVRAVLWPGACSRMKASCL